MIHTYHNSDIAKWAKVAEECGAMMALTYMAAAVASSCLGNITTTGLFISLHTVAASGGSPGTEFTNYSGNRPAVTWGAVSNGVVVSSDTQTFTLTGIASGGLPYFGIYSANTGGTYLFGGATSGLSGSIPSGAVVTFTSSITLTQAG